MRHSCRTSASVLALAVLLSLPVHEIANQVLKKLCIVGFTFELALQGNPFKRIVLV